MGVAEGEFARPAQRQKIRSDYTFKRRKVLKNGLTTVQRVRQALLRAQKPVTKKQLLSLCKMGFYHLKAALEELCAKGEAFQDRHGYRLKLVSGNSNS